MIWVRLSLGEGDGGGGSEGNILNTAALRSAEEWFTGNTCGPAGTFLDGDPPRAISLERVRSLSV